MELDSSLIAEPPTLNEAVYKWFADFPIYMRHDLLNPHNYRMHIQPGIELNLTLEGQGTYVIDKSILKQSPGKLLIFSGKLPHQIFINEPRSYKRMVVLIDDGALPALWPNEGFYWFSDVTCEEIKLEPDAFMTVKQLLFAMYKEMQEREIGWQQMIVSGLMQLAFIVRRSLSREGRKPDESPIFQLCAYIHKHLHEDLTLKKMSHFFHRSPDHIIRIFKREKGMTFYQYVLLQRVLESQRLLLQHPEMSLTEIAYSVGFSSSSQFCKTFKSLNGQPPSRFRQMT